MDRDYCGMYTHMRTTMILYVNSKQASGKRGTQYINGQKMTNLASDTLVSHTVLLHAAAASIACSLCAGNLCRVCMRCLAC